MGELLGYAHSVDYTMLPSLNTIAEQQSNLTKNTEAAITQFLDYAAINPSVIMQYKYIGIFTFTVMHHTYHNHRHAAALNGTIN